MCWDLEHGRVLTEDTRSRSVLSSQSGHLSIRLSGQNVARDSRKFAYGTTGGCEPASWRSFHFEPRKRAQVSALQPRQPSSGQSNFSHGFRFPPMQGLIFTFFFISVFTDTGTIDTLPFGLPKFSLILYFLSLVRLFK